MAHNIEQYDGEASFVSARDLPWHNLGKVVENAMTAAEALKLARLDWEVKTMPVYAQTPNDKSFPLEIKGKQAVYRDNPSKGGDPIIFNVVGDKWTAVQNVEAFAFLDNLVDAKGGAHYETAGVLGQGQKVFMTIKMPNDIVIDPKGSADKIENYILVSNGHDGTLSFTVAVTPIRVVCQNTLTMALKSAERVWRITHTKTISGRMAEAQHTLQLTVKYAEELQSVAEQMIQHAYTDRQFSQLVKRLYPIQTEERDLIKERKQETHDRLNYLFVEAETQANIRGTKWAAFQAVTEYIDWDRKVRGGKANSADEKRAQDVLFGRAINQKQEALELLKA